MNTSQKRTLLSVIIYLIRIWDPLSPCFNDLEGTLTFFSIYHNLRYGIDKWTVILLPAFLYGNWCFNRSTGLQGHSYLLLKLQDNTWLFWRCRIWRIWSSFWKDIYVHVCFSCLLYERPSQDCRYLFFSIWVSQAKTMKESFESNWRQIMRWY